MKALVPFFLLCSFLFFTPVTSEQDHVCIRPELTGNIVIAGIQKSFGPGVVLALSCQQGYTPVSGPREIVCTVSGEWTKTKFKCIPKRCPYPDPPSNGDLYYEDTVYQSTVNYTCYEGYIMTGSSTAVCQADGTWSTTVPECKPVECGLAPVPKNGMVIYDKKVRGNTTEYSLTATYVCLPPYAISGDPTAECTASGAWTKTPECQVVTCPPPGRIEKGYLSNSDQKEYFFMEKIKCGCDENYVLEGNLDIVCQKDGQWSEKPSCKAPCTFGIQRAQILYKGRKMWSKDLQPNLLLHGELISVYCSNKDRKCAYAAQTQCMDGTLKIPECFEEPSGIDSDSLPSEIEQC
ncbi:beta-2-glycoprotein 1-like [Menidia menidia]